MGTFDGFDCSFNPPDYKQAYAAGFRWVVRYLSYPSGKVLDAAEVKRIHNAGLGIILNWEFDSHDALGGRSNGVKFGAEAARQAHSLGLGKNYPIIFSADFDVRPNQFATVDSYLAGAKILLRAYGFEVGVYAPAGYLKHAMGMFAAGRGPARYYWQPLPPSAWYGNGSKWAGAHLWQTENQKSIWGGTVDLDKMNANHRIPVWSKPTPVVVRPPAPKPQEKPVPVKQLHLTQRLKVNDGVVLNSVGRYFKYYLEIVYNHLGLQAELARLAITSNYRKGDPGWHGKYTPSAVDISGIHGRNPQADKDMKHLAVLLWSNRSTWRELIHSTPYATDHGYYVKDGRVVGASFYGEPDPGPNGHLNHVHTAVELKKLQALIARTLKAYGYTHTA